MLQVAQCLGRSRRGETASGNDDSVRVSAHLGSTLIVILIVMSHRCGTAELVKNNHLFYCGEVGRGCQPTRAPYALSVMWGALDLGA